MSTVEELSVAKSLGPPATAWRAELLANIVTREALDELGNSELYRDPSLYGAYDGIEVLDDRQGVDGGDYRCLHYVFGTIQDEPWGHTGIWALEELNRDDWGSAEVLDAIGYQIVDIPKKGDVALYFFNYFLMHAGIFEGEGKVVSKWGSGPIIRHPIDLLPAGYGHDIVFLRKVIDGQS